MRSSEQSSQSLVVLVGGVLDYMGWLAAWLCVMQEAVFSVRLGVGGALAVIIQHKSSLVSHAPENSVAGVEGACGK